MLETELRAKLSQCTPSWADATITAMQQGQSEHSFLLTRRADKALFKWDRTPRAEFLISRELEATVQSAAASHGLSPEVLFADSESILTEFCEATVLSVDDLQQHSNLLRLGKLLRMIHQLPSSGRQFGLDVAASHYSDGVEQNETTVRAHAAICDLPTPDSVVLSHGDVVVGNILESSSLLLIDWEYAADRSALFDLATVVAHHSLAPAAVQQFLNAYEPAGIDLELFRVYVRAYHALHWLWLHSREPQHTRLRDIAKEF